MQKVYAMIGKDKYRTIIKSETNHIIADEPAGVGGKDLGFSPDELLASSLAACTAITLRMYADRKQYQLDSVEVTVSVEWNKTTSTTNFRKVLKFNGNLNEEELGRLKDISDKCPTHRAMQNPMTITTELANSY
jgi:putative redox protein